MSELLYTPKPNRLLLPTADEWPKDIPDFTPYKTRDPAVLHTVRGGNPGVRVRFDEVRALKLFYEMLRRTNTPEEAAEVGTLGAVAMFGGSAYLLRGKRTLTAGRNVREVQNRYVELKPFASNTSTRQPSTEELRERSLDSIKEAIDGAQQRLKNHIEGESASRAQSAEISTGRIIANTAVYFAVIGIGDTIADLSNNIGYDESQYMGRDACADAVRIGRDVSSETGYNLSLIHYADKLAPGSIEAQKAASDSMFENYHQSFDAIADWTLAA
jgi:hypothetical protein